MGQTLDFQQIKAAVAAQFQRMQQGGNQLFRADVSGDELWALYLESFPPGANPVYRERTEHDCSCCRQFVRTVGNVVAIVSGELVSVWSTGVPQEPAYDAVCTALAARVLAAPIAGPFVHYEPSAGVDRTFEELDLAGRSEESGLDSPSVRTWTHFHVNLDRRLVRAKDSIPTYLSEARSAHDVFLRSLREITEDSIETVLDLIAQGSLYRGEEHRSALVVFQTLKSSFGAVPDARREDLFAWLAGSAASGAVTRIRNTAIGTLLVDLSTGRDLEESVRSFEAKVAPTNYKRPSALVTPAMIAKAKERIEELGLTSALDRRYARITDVSIEDVLFADRSARRAMGCADVFDDLAVSAAATAPKSLNLDKVEAVPVDRFIAEILPRAESVEVLFENRHAGNLVSLIAPADATARHLFKWPNNFSWSYAGELADSIREKVKRAGGNVSGDLCCRLAWHNTDDLDFHMREPDGSHISFMGKRSRAGQLDVDMNVCGETREPVENIFYGHRKTMQEGEYHLYVNQYNARETTDVGFEVEIDYLGTVRRFSYDKRVRREENVTVAKFRYTHAAGIEIVESLPESQSTRTLWGLSTGAFHRVSAVMLSPNYWAAIRGTDHGVGNKHFIFALDGCRNDGSSRGFFNEFLHADLDPHRKVFEMVGARMKPAESEEQLSGLGFSSTQRNELVCRIKGSFTRTIKVTF